MRRLTQLQCKAVRGELEAKLFLLPRVTVPKELNVETTIGISKRSETAFQTSMSVQSFNIGTWLVPNIQKALANRVAMMRVHRQVCAWLAEERPAEEAVTDAEFAAFVRGVVEEVRGSSQDLVDWRYHTKLAVPREKNARHLRCGGVLLCGGPTVFKEGPKPQKTLSVARPYSLARNTPVFNASRHTCPSMSLLAMACPLASCLKCSSFRICLLRGS